MECHQLKGVGSWGLHRWEEAEPSLDPRSV